MDEIYSRQERLILNNKNSVAVVGVGGIGFWAGLFLAMSGITELWLYDSDNVELTNLNRLPLDISHCGQKKCVILKKLINKLRPTCNVFLWDNWRQGIMIVPDIILDCCDDFPTQSELKKYVDNYNIQTQTTTKKQYHRAGYDGQTRISIYRQIPDWGDGTNEKHYGGHNPSWVVPAVIGGALAASSVLMLNSQDFCFDLIDLFKLKKGINDGIWE